MSPDEFLRWADLLPDPLLLLTSTGEIVAGNRRGQREIGFAAQSPGTLSEAVCETAQQVQEYLRLCSRSRQPIVGRLTLRGRGDNGRQSMRCEGSLLSPRSGELPPLLLLRLTSQACGVDKFLALNEQINALHREIARRREVEQQLRLQTEELRTTLASIGDGVIVCDAQGAVVEMNYVAEQLTQWTREEGVGRPLPEVFRIVNEYSRKTVESPVDRVLREGVIVGLANHTVLIGRDGAERPIDDSAAPIRDGGGRLRGVVLVFRDGGQRRMVEAALRQSEERARLAIAAAQLGVWHLDLTTEVLTASKLCKELLGLPHDFELTEDTFLGAIHADDRERVAGLIHKAIRELDSYECEFRVVWPDGSMRWIVSRGRVTYGADDKLLYMHGVLLDITSRKQVEEALRRSQERLSLAQRAAEIGAFDWNVETGEIAWTEELEGLYGLEPGGFSGAYSQWLAAVHPEDRVRADAEVRHAAQHVVDLDHEFRIVRPDGAVRWIASRARVFFDEAGQSRRLLGVNVDITDRKQAELRDRLLVELSAAFVSSLDEEAVLKEVSAVIVPSLADYCYFDVVGADGALRRLAVTHAQPAAQELLQRAAAFVPGPKTPHDPVMSALESGQLLLVRETSEAWLEQAAHDDTHRRLLAQLNPRSVLITPLSIGNQRLGVLTLALTSGGRRYAMAEAVLAEEVARRAALTISNAQLYRQLQESDRRKNEFLAMLAHELRNPLAPLRSGLAILAMGDAGEAEVRETRDIMERQVEHLVRLVDDLLDVSRIMRGRIELRPEIIELSEVISRAVETTRPNMEERRHTLHVRLPSQPVHLRGDRIRLAQVFSNLLHNAARYTDPGGRIELHAELDGRSPGSVAVRVVDQGIGLETEMIARIFEMFVQAPGAAQRGQGGLGLGLTLVKRLVELHDGAVFAASPGPGKGSEFTVRLPIIAAASSSQAATTAPPPPPRRRVLVVDDNVDAARTLAFLLKHRGQEVRTAHSGQEALGVAAEFRPQLIMLDIGMPGMDGHETAQRLRELPEGGQFTLAAVTGWGQDEDRRRSLAAGFNHHLVKPVKLADVEAILKELPPDET